MQLGGCADVRSARSQPERQPLQDLEQNEFGTLLSTIGACRLHSEEEWRRAGTPDEAAASRHDRTNGSAKSIAGAAQVGKPRRLWSLPRRLVANHPPAAGVNRAASQLHVGCDDGPSGWHGSVGREGTLVAPGGRSLRLSARLLGAVAVTVTLAAVAAAPDDHPATAAQTEKQPCRDLLRLFRLADPSWTNAAIGGTMSLHSCPARCGARRRCRTAKLRSTQQLDGGNRYRYGAKPRHDGIPR
jgi:hypothetical protein